jgi:hypothetical protein
LIAAAGACATPSGLLAAAAAGPRVVTRKNAATLGANDPGLRSFREAVRRMKRRPASDARSWASLARQHAAGCAESAGHGGATFLAWHRAWLHLVEKALQVAAGNPRLALPYWDWTRDLKVPAAFRSADSPLFASARQVEADEELPADFADVGPSIRAKSLEAFLGSPDPDSSDYPAAGLVECTVAGNVRHWIGGDMAGCATAALDPLYLAHCANLDRLWEAWRAAWPEQSAMPAAWTKATLELPDPAGTKARFLLADLARGKGLRYRYDSLDFRVSARKEPAANRARRAVLEFERSRLPPLPATFRLFLNNTDARPATPPAGSTYAGTYTLFPDAAETGLESRLPIEVSAEMGHRIAVQAAVAVTLIPIAVPGRTLPLQIIRLQNARLVTVD